MRITGTIAISMPSCEKVYGGPYIGMIITMVIFEQAGKTQGDTEEDKLIGLAYNQVAQ